jgi:hypothetical protein
MPRLDPGAAHSAIAAPAPCRACVAVPADGSCNPAAGRRNALPPDQVRGMAFPPYVVPKFVLKFAPNARGRSPAWNQVISE